MSYLRYVAIGDSTTEGMEDPYPSDRHLYDEHGHRLSPSHPSAEGSYRGWSDRLAVHIARAQPEPLEYANLAIRGRKLPEIHREQLAVALAMRPDVMTIVGGVNDAARPGFNPVAARGHIAAMFRAARRQDVTVVTFTMPDAAKVNWMVRPLAKNLHQLNDITREEAERYGVVLCDLAHSPIGTDPRLWHVDRLHASPQGHEIIGHALAAALGLPGFAETLRHELPAADPTSWRQRRAADATWLREYFVPFVKRRRSGISMGDGVRAKRPTPTVVDERMFLD